MKIAFITEGDPLNHNQWSGTVCQMYRALKIDNELVEIDISGKNILVNFFCRVFEVLSKLFKKKYIRTYSLLKAKYDSGKVTRQLKKITDIDLIFCPARSGSIAFVKTNIPIFYLTDATFAQMIDYYPYLSNLCTMTVFEGNKIDQRALANARTVIAASNWAKASMMNDYDVPEHKINVVPFGANLSIDIEKVEKDDAFHILFCGVDWERKGGQIAVDAVKELHARGFHVTLDLVGCNPPLEVNEQYIRMHGFLNKNNREEFEKLKTIYAKTDILLLPTQAECAGIVFAEASGYKIPSITFDTGGIESYVCDGVNGFRLPLGSNAADFADKIQLVIEDDSLLKDLRHGAEEIFKNKLNWNCWRESTTGIILENCFH